MTAKTFGRRGLAPAGGMLRQNLPLPVAIQSPQVEKTPAPEVQAEQVEEITGERSLASQIPMLTAGMILFFLLIYLIERHFAFDLGKGGALSHESLLAMGAASFDLAIGSGQVWRLFLAPILHADASHVIGNCVALAFVGSRLEPWISRSWFGAIFVVSALGGLIGSFSANPTFLVTVGASGAISGLIGALFMMSFHYSASEDEQYRMRMTALKFGAPALLPLALGASGNVDYFAHLGGAIAGALAGWALSSLWPEASEQRKNTAMAMKFALAGLALSCLSAGAAATQYSAYALEAAKMLPMSAYPAKDADIDERMFNLYARYPHDPRSHIFRAIYLASRNRLADAEAELRTAMIKARDMGTASAKIIDLANFYLALVLAQQGRRGEALNLARNLCAAPDKTFRPQLNKSRLCG